MGSAALAPGDAIAGRFGLGRPTAPMRRLSADEIGIRWSLATDSGRWSVRELEPGYEHSAARDVRLQEAAAAAGVAIAAPVRSRAGCIVEVIDDRRWRVHEWLDAAPSMVTPVAAD